jgi:uncharacterized protein (TIGR02421 family)
VNRRGAWFAMSEAGRKPIDETLARRVADLVGELQRLAKPILVLKHLNWPDAVEDAFLTGWRAGRPELPVVTCEVPDWSAEITALDNFVARCGGDDPLLEFLRRTAWSYAEAGRMLVGAGTPEFTARSINLYGRPDDVYDTQAFTGADAAAFLLEKTDPLIRGGYVAPPEAEQSAEQFAQRLQRAVDEYFVDDRVTIVVDADLSSKAIAGTTKIRIRASAKFSELDFDQLFHHEALIHSGTALNGRRQPRFCCLGLGAPRTTRTQEGIAVFAELVTRSIDVERLRRLALRIKALASALDGADFLECFQMFLEAAQDEREAYKSAQRIFRGGDVRGAIAFTKDSAYLKGLMETHVFMNVAIRDGQPLAIERLFAGRLTLSDVVTLGPYFESGFLERPRYVPPWARDTRRLAAALAYSSFMMNVNLASVSLDRFVQAASRMPDR